MGGKHSHSFDQTQFNSQWQRKQSNHQGRTLWKNKQQPQSQIEQYPIFANTDDQIDREQKLFALRRNSQDLVSASYLKQTKKGGLCSNSAQGRLFLERVPLKLQALQHIPFPDVLHLNMNALTGYEKLFKTVGPFRPQEQQIGFNTEGMAKVWLSGDYSQSKPASVQQSESAMVRNILQLIEDNTDRNTTPRQNQSILNYVYRENPEVGFQQAQRLVHEYAQRYNNGVIPASLQCIKRVGIDHISKSLTTMRENGVVTSLNNVPRATFNTVQPPVFTSTTTTTNVPAVRSTIVVPPPAQRVVTTTGSTFVPPPVLSGSTFVPPPPVVKRSSIVNFSTTNNPVNVSVVQSKVQPQQPVQPVVQSVQQVPVQQSQVKVVRPPQVPVQQIVRQGPVQQNVVFASQPFVVPQQQAVQQQRVAVIPIHQVPVPQVITTQPQAQVVPLPVNVQRQIVQQQTVTVVQNKNNQISRKVQTVQVVEEATQQNEVRNVIQSTTTNVTYNTRAQQQHQQQDNNLGFIESTSSRFRDVSLEDGKSSQALLAELRNLSTKVYTPDTTANYKSYQQYNNYDYEDYSTSNRNVTNVSEMNGNTSGGYSYSSTLENNGQNYDGYGQMFNKYAQRAQEAQNNLQDNLQMKYSMTQDQYEQNYSQEYDGHEGEYNVDYDPEILADIQRMRN